MRRTIIVASQPRTGSSLLVERMTDTGVAGAPAEFFSERSLNWTGRATGRPRLTTSALIRTYARRARLHRYWESTVGFADGTVRDYLDEVVVRRTTPNGVFAVKLHWRQLRALTTDHGVELADFPQPVDWVWIRRRDRLALAVSWVRAAQRNVWNSNEGRRDRLESDRYDAVEIEHALSRAVESEQGWSDFFDANDVHPVEVTFEDLAGDPDAVTERVLSELGIDLPNDYTPRPAALRRQADTTTADWIERFRRDRPETCALAETLVIGR